MPTTPISTGIETFFISQGVLGVACILLIWYILRQQSAHKEEIAAKDALINELQEKRVAEMGKTGDMAMRVLTTLDALKERIVGKG